jgi:uncharacterized MAPEG superfamily protein
MIELAMDMYRRAAQGEKCYVCFPLFVALVLVSRVYLTGDHSHSQMAIAILERGQGNQLVAFQWCPTHMR